jgi:hypothetical protein
VKAEDKTFSNFSFQAQPVLNQPSAATAQNVCNQFQFTKLIYKTSTYTKKLELFKTNRPE